MHNPSGYVILCHAVIDNKSHDAIWTEDDICILKKVKNSVVVNQNTTHFGATGKYFSFGMNACYKVDKKKSSLGTYGIKVGKNEKLKKKICI